MTGFKSKYWLYVAKLRPEVDEVAPKVIERLNPGRDRDAPRAYLGYTCDQHPTVRFPDGDFSDGISILRQYGDELMREAEFKKRTTSELPMLRYMDRKIAELRGRGWTVFNEPPRRDHQVYVFELEDAAKRLKRAREQNPDADHDMPCVYVGQSGLSPEERLERHLSGNKASPVVRDHFKRCLPAFYEHLNPLTRRESLEKERNLTRTLRAVRYTVLSG